VYKVLFVCVGNAGRSQVAEAFFNSLAKGKAVASSAGTVPASRVDPLVIKLMQEEGIDISGAVPKMLTQEMLDKADRVITMGCGVENVCPAKWIATEDWGLPDPKGKTIEEIRLIRDDIRTRVIRLLDSI
jgi:arsenate reductase